jgi:DNA-binding transcriptional LysR family regulator
VDLAAIRVFVAVAQSGGFSPGAKAVGLTRSAAGKALARLEGRLGTRLLHRTTRSIALTAEGQTFYERCRQILADLEEAEAEVRDDHLEPRGSLRLTLPDTFGRRHVLPLLNRYLKAWPALTAEVSLTDRVVDVVEEGYDLAVRCGGQLSDTRLIARVIARSHAILCAAPDYLAVHGEPSTADDLLHHSRLTLGERSDARAWRLAPPNGKPLRITDPGRLHLNSGEALRQAASEGLGVAYLPSFLVGPDIAAGRLRALLTDHGTEEIVVRAIYPSRRHLAGKVRMLVDDLAKGLTALSFDATATPIIAASGPAGSE